MIDSSELFDPIDVEIRIPFTNLDLQFFSVKNWDGKGLRMSMSLFKEFMDTYFRVVISDELRRDKKFTKKIIDINADMVRYTEKGIVYILLENYNGGLAKIEQLVAISSEIDKETFESEGWDRFSEVFLFSMKNKTFGLSLRSTIEAKILKNALEKNQFNLVNDKKETEDKIKIAEFQLKDLEVQEYYKGIRVALKCYGIKLLE